MGLLDSLGSVVGGGPEGDGDEEAAEQVSELRQDFREQAEDLADQWSERNLDFTTTSLARLDRKVDERYDDARFRDARFRAGDQESTVFSGLVVRLGAYFGEVLVRNLDAEWEDDEEFGSAVRVPGGEEDAVVNVFNVAARSLRGDPQFVDTYRKIEAET